MFKLFGLCEDGLQKLVGLLFMDVMKLLERRKGSDEPMHEPATLLEVIIVVQEGNDVLPADQGSSHRNIRTICVNAASLV